MGMIPATISCTDALFSRVQRRVLGLLFANAERSFYGAEIIRSVRSGSGAVERELSRLQGSGLVSVERIGNQKHYRANKDSPIFPEMKSLIAKTIGLADPIRESLTPYAEVIASAFVFGSMAKGTATAQSDIDLMVIGDDLNYSELYGATQQAEARLHRKINPLFLSVREWRKKSADTGSVVNKISNAPKIFVLGSEKDLRKWESLNSTIS